MKAGQQGNQATRLQEQGAAFTHRRAVTLLISLFFFHSTARAADATLLIDPIRSREIVFKHALQTVAPVIVRIDTIGGAQPVHGEMNVMQEQRITTGFRQADGPTTGVIWSADGYILTSSFNFVRDPVVITVTLADGRKFVAKLLARDYPARLALLKIEVSELPEPDWQVPGEIRPGQWTLAAGWGFGAAQPTLTAGIVSAVRRKDGRAVQTDAKISPVNYGGPLFDVEGRLLGICVPMGLSEDELAGVEWYDSGIGFAIRRDFIEPRIGRLMQGIDLRRGLLGVNLDVRQSVAGEQTETQSSARPPGVQVIGRPLGPAEQAGLQGNDFILSIDGVPTADLVAFRRAMAGKAAGDEIEVRYLRGDEERTARVRLAFEEEFRATPADEP